jgi:hypothetical protein
MSVMTSERFLALPRPMPTRGVGRLNAWPAAAGRSPAAARWRADAADALLHASRGPSSMALRDCHRLGRRGRAEGDAGTTVPIGRRSPWGPAGRHACAGIVAGAAITTLTADAQAEAVLYQASLLGVDDAEVLG